MSTIQEQPSVPASELARGDAHVPRARFGGHALLLAQVAAILVLIAAFSALNSSFFTLGNFQAVANQSAILLVISIGMTLVILVGGIDLSVPGVMGLASLAFTLLVLNDRNSQNLGVLAIIIVLGLGAAIGALTGVVNVKFKVPSFMSSLGVGTIAIGIATLLYGSSTPRILDPEMRTLGLGRIGGVSYLIVIALVITLAFWWLQNNSRFGRMLYVIGGDERIATLAGVAVNRYKVLTFMIAGALFALAGIMASVQVGVGAVDIGLGQEFAAITAVVLGGTLLQGGSGGVVNTLLGTIIIGILTNGLILSEVDQHVQLGVRGAVIVVAIVVTSWKLRKRGRVVK
ncbi:ABC transporter permease [Pseudactinotalea sp. HY158]|uniref:ABC transporter permease n=1 Tax=Pseudactinotalea sp. HY158 TaxID=2654547 RepID=UPI00129C73D1|nr:ABC transporter permease [Pseudactinotalea sp. HY158]QGH68520.1 ABC transporter permease [Pseudactinotalea sp. HY158]